MAYFLKGNYQVPTASRQSRPKKKTPKSLTEQFEESALAKLGGSLCFVMKGSTFVWTGEENEKAGS